MKRYLVRATVTISLHQHVFAESAEEAVEKAAELAMPCISRNDDWHYKIPKDPKDQSDEWRTSGELDGEATDLHAEFDEVDQ